MSPILNTNKKIKQHILKKYTQIHYFKIFK